MKATGIVRKVDELGRVVIPMELRRTFGIGEKDPLEIYTDGDRIVLRKYAPGCQICGDILEDGEYEEYNGKQVCHSCINELVQQTIK